MVFNINSRNDLYRRLFSRYKACSELKIPYEWVDYEGNDPLGYVLSLNLHRRHLNESQRAMVAARLANMGSGGYKSKDANLRVSHPEAAEMLNVSERSVSTAKKAQYRKEFTPP